MKIYMMTDMEGVAGVAEWHQAKQADTPAYRAAARWQTREINAAIAGAFDGGATEVIVNDSHFGGGNLVFDELDPRGRYVYGHRKPEWLPLLDRSVAGVFIQGQHAMAGTAVAALCHTQSSEAWKKFTLNGIEMGELGQVAALAGAVGVPVVLVTGDDKACREGKRLLKKVETVEVKKSLGRECVATVTPARACELIREGAERAVRNVRKFKPLRLRAPFTATLEFLDPKFMARYPEVPGRKRIGPCTVRFSARTMKGLFALITG